MPLSAREIAVMALEAYRRSGAWIEAYLNGLFKKENTEPRERALATNICCGVMQNLSLIDYRLSAYLSGKTERLQPKVLDILRVGAYQIMFMDKIPPHAAVSESVALAKKLANRGAAGLVNAVLRRVTENRGKYPEPKEPWIKYSHTKEWYDYFSRLIGEEKTELLMREDNAAAPITLLANPLKCSAEELIRELESSGVSAREHPWLKGSVEISGAGDLSGLGAFKSGLFMVQDAAATLAVLAAAPEAGENVLDACAAPGGKSFAAAMLMRNRGRVLSCDLHENKLSRIESGARRLGLDIITARAINAAEYRAEMEGKFDLIIADVPCSGLGVIRKKPEIRYKSFSDIATLGEIQYNILKNLSRYLKPGGRLVYSTCTLMREENGDVIGRFINESGNFVREGFELPPPIGRVDGGELTLYPFEYGTDGFYICKMRKTK